LRIARIDNQHGENMKAASMKYQSVSKRAASMEASIWQRQRKYENNGVMTASK
jgi:hypothetical protein